MARRFVQPAAPEAFFEHVGTCRGSTVHVRALDGRIGVKYTPVSTALRPKWTRAMEVLGAAAEAMGGRLESTSSWGSVFLPKGTDLNLAAAQLAAAVDACPRRKPYRRG